MFDLIALEALTEIIGDLDARFLGGNTPNLNHSIGVEWICRLEEKKNSSKHEKPNK
jgi:hypothetical protein